MTDLVVARPYESVVAQIPTDVSGDDFSVDTIFGNEILVRTGLGGGGGGCCCAPIAFSLSGRHDGVEVAMERRMKGRKSAQGRGWRDVKVKHTTAA